MKPLLAIAAFAILAGCSGGGGGASRLTGFKSLAFKDYLANKLGPSTSPDDYFISEERSGGFVVVSISPKKRSSVHFGGNDRDGYSTKMSIDVKTGKIVKKTIAT